MEAPAEEAFPQGRRCYVGNLAWRTSWQDLKDHFKPCGNVVYANVMQDTSGRSRGWGIVEYETAEEATQACTDLNGTELDGRNIMVREDREDRDIKRPGAPGAPASGATRRPASRQQREGESSGLQVVVHGIPWSFDDAQLTALFKDFDSGYEIESAEVVYGKDNRSRGYGTVRFTNAEQAEKAVSDFNGWELEGRSLTVKMDQFA